ncbi:hypothetical protein Cgig2_024341 [Carnegiea gigantea]|uniref:Uncharacterized protein n=1 Tax=Carnegiea gigantea TaxID=171969 RepID=A0A9Q1K2J9_9CARY|nr:hypothetical protein Cgig2_024341 [Carnegiea gigantea]
MNSSTPKRRPKSASQNPNFKPQKNGLPSHSPSTSSCSTITSLLAEVEPPPNLLPSKSEFLKLIVVIAIAAIVATACNFLLDFVPRPPVPFCDSDVEYDDSVAGTLDLLRYPVSNVDLKGMLENSGLIQSSTVDNITYMYIQERALEYLSRLLDTRMTDEWIKEFKCPDRLAESYEPITCRARQWIAKHFLFLIPVCALLVGCTVSVLRIRRRWYLTKRAEQLYHQVCDILEENALMSKSIGDREPWLVASRLRDHLLSPRERRDSFLWRMVCSLLYSLVTMRLFGAFTKFCSA